MIGMLTSSFGIFVSKALGLLYYSPLSSLAGESNMAFYSITYTYYDQLLKISSAGIPFAIAALTARYYAKEDYKTVLLVKKMGTSMIMTLSFLSAIVFLFVSTPLARQSMGAFASEADIRAQQALFRILIIAVILVPYLSSIRGYYQGLKRLDLYASSQALEQFARVFCILFFGYIVIKVFSFERIWAIYIAIAAAGAAALIAIIFFKLMVKEDDRRIKELITEQDTPSETKKLIFAEIITLGLPYLMISLLGSSSALINTTFFMDVATSSGIAVEEAKLSLGILQANCLKLSSIPQVLTLGFSSGLVPYLSESLEKRDNEKISAQISLIIETCLFILIPLIFIFVFFARDIYFIMYGNSNLDLGTSLFRFNCLVTFIETICPIVSSIMITLRHRTYAIVTLLITVFIKYISFVILVKYFGAYGMIVSTAIANGFVLFAYILKLELTYDLHFMRTIVKSIKTAIASLIMVLPAFILHHFINIAYDSRLVCLFFMGVLGLVMLGLYYFSSVLFKLPQELFNTEDVSPKALLRRFRS